MQGSGEPVKAFTKGRASIRAEASLYLLQGGRTREGGRTEAVSQKTLSVRLRSTDSPTGDVEPQNMAFKQRNDW